MSDSPLPRVGILISGRGSNMAALIEAMQRGDVGATPALVISDRASAGGLARATTLGVPTRIVTPRDHRGVDENDSRARLGRALAAALDAAEVEFVCLAGYLRLLDAAFVRRYAGRMLNIHPSLLPAFPGLHAQRQALAHGVKVAGCTVHFVEPDLDSGPIIAQAAVPVLPGDDETALAGRILAQEHVIYPRVLAWLCAGRLKIEGRHVLISDSLGTKGSVARSM